MRGEGSQAKSVFAIKMSDNLYLSLMEHLKLSHLLLLLSLLLFLLQLSLLLLHSFMLGSNFSVFIANLEHDKTSFLHNKIYNRNNENVFVFAFRHLEVVPPFFCMIFFVLNLQCKIPQFQVFWGKVNFYAQILELRSHIMNIVKSSNRAIFNFF